MAEGISVCPGCGLRRPSAGLELDRRANASGECRALMNELSYYTLSHGVERFIHQHAVDAYGAQHIPVSKSTIGAAFTLAGLYLAVEKGYTGRQVQQTHIVMGKHSKTWPTFIPPANVGAMTVADVVAAAPGPARDQRLLDWCEAVWAAWADEQPRVREMVKPFLGS